jgi:hypothetical protein
LDPGSLADWFGGLGEWCGAIAGCIGGMATFLAVLVALFSQPLEEGVRRLIQRRGAEIAGVSQIEEESSPQGRQLKTRLKIRNRTSMRDTYKVYVAAVAGRSDFIAVPLVWMHGHAMGEELATAKELGGYQHGWIEFLTVRATHSPSHAGSSRLLLGVGVGAGVRQLEGLPAGRTELTLCIAPHYGNMVSYATVVQWDGTYSHPRVEWVRN